MRRHTYPGAREGTSHPPRICRSPSSIFGLVEDQVEVGAMGLADESHAKELRRCFEPIIFGVTFDPIVGAPSKLKTACCKDYGPNRALLPANITAATVMACVANVVMSHEGNAAVDLRSTYTRTRHCGSLRSLYRMAHARCQVSIAGFVLCRIAPSSASFVEQRCDRVEV